MPPTTRHTPPPRLVLVVEGRGLPDRCYLPPEALADQEIARAAHAVRADVTGTGLSYGDYQRPDQMDAAERSLLALGFRRTPLAGIRIAADQAGTLRAGSLPDLEERPVVVRVRCEGEPPEQTYVFLPPSMRWKRAAAAIASATERHAARADERRRARTAPPPSSAKQQEEVRAIYEATGLVVLPAIIDR